MRYAVVVHYEAEDDERAKRIAMHAADAVTRNGGSSVGFQTARKKDGQVLELAEAVIPGDAPSAS